MLFVFLLDCGTTIQQISGSQPAPPVNRTRMTATLQVLMRLQKMNACRQHLRLSPTTKWAIAVIEIWYATHPEGVIDHEFLARLLMASLRISNVVMRPCHCQGAAQNL